MLKINADGIYQSTRLLQISGLIHGYSTRKLGDMRGEDNRKKLLRLMGLPSDTFVMAKQVHGDKVHEIKNNRTRIVENADGLIEDTDKGSRSIGVHVADCVPILIVDSKTKMICAIHAGWRGTLLAITKQALQHMKQKGSDPKHLAVSIGPHIGMCHYDVDSGRAKKFLEAFDNNPNVASMVEGKWYVDIGFANLLQMLSEGVSLQNIDAPPTCTSCQTQDYYSYRADTKESFGEIMGVVGFKN